MRHHDHEQPLLAAIARLLSTAGWLWLGVVGGLAAACGGGGGGNSCAAEVIGDLGAAPSIAIQGLQPGAQAVTGVVDNVDARTAAVVLWALTDRYYVQPLVSAPYTPICSNGAWINDTNPWTAIVALLVDRSVYVPGATVEVHPSLAAGVLAWDQFPPRRPGLPLVFAGETWDAKTSVPGRFDPGPNYWSDSEQNVFVDASGLHLRIIEVAAQWICPEVILTRSLGYGVYEVQIEGDLTALPSNVVASMFLYEQPGREFDIEWSADLVEGPENAQFVNQPFTVAGNVERFVMPPIAQSTHRIEWREGSLQFTSWRGFGAYPPAEADLIRAWEYTGPSVPTPGVERFRCNLWLLGGAPPATASGSELVLRSFVFTR